MLLQSVPPIAAPKPSTIDQPDPLTIAIYLAIAVALFLAIRGGYAYFRSRNGNDKGGKS